MDSLFSRLETASRGEDDQMVKDFKRKYFVLLNDTRFLEIYTDFFQFASHDISTMMIE